MKLGAEPKKIAILAALLLLGAWLIYRNVTSSDAPPPSPRAQAVNVPEPRADTPADTRTLRPSVSGRGGVQEFRPSLKSRRAEDRPDPSTVDPTLRLDLLAKLRDIKVEGGMRSLFEFSQAPPPPPSTPDPKIIPKAARFMGPLPPPPAPAIHKPPPPPITLRFYGYVSAPRPGVKRGFFLDGDDIIVASEGDLIKRRYKIVRIGINSVVVEDTDYKNQQTLPLIQELGS